jgi:hypothetical protein
MTNEDIVSYVEAHIGGARQSRIVRPLILAMANLAYSDLAKLATEQDPLMAEKLKTTLANQTWATSQFTLPTNFLRHKQIEFTKVYFGTTLAHQVRDRETLDMITGMLNIYYAIEGLKLYVKHTGGTSSGTNLNISYIKIPTVSDLDDELTPTFLQLLMARLQPQPPIPNNGTR